MSNNADQATQDAREWQRERDMADDEPERTAEEIEAERADRIRDMQADHERNNP